MRKNALYLLMVILITAGCSSYKQQVVVTNTLSQDRINEIVEVPLCFLTAKKHVPTYSHFVVLDENKHQVPYQITYDSLLIFPATVNGLSKAVYTISKGKPNFIAVTACGRLYPERLDDMAWENDCIGYRAYGPALQAKGEKGFGYDIFTKSIKTPILTYRYALELNKEYRREIVRLKQLGQRIKADSLSHAISYHRDHGNGMDCYAVGPTLGCATTALYVDSTIVYPYCFKKYHILDNGPLRFTVKLSYNPSVVRGDSNVIETRLIKLDKGSPLNKTLITYKNLHQSIDLLTGIVIHPQNPQGYTYNLQKKYIIYADSTEDAHNNNGVIYIGAVFPGKLKTAGVKLFSEKEKMERGALGHVMAISKYSPNKKFVYYWGAGWSKYGFPDVNAWKQYIEDFSSKIINPLQVDIR